ncbi:MAG TPA: adenylate/guanylate cyclase domain-containing protein [Longimicrobium sp.]|nr:adenylate/guanylate cyclase domain-containing protein [Longimicrobium sp.]
MTPARVAAALDRVRHSFAAKLLLALIASVGVLLLVTVLSIRVQTHRQVAVAVARSLAQSRKVFAQQERDLRESLESSGVRWAGSNRLPAALDDALQSGSTEVLAQTTSYEFQLAASRDTLLAAYTDAAGRPVATVMGNAMLADPAAGVPLPLVSWLLPSDSIGAFGYHLVAGRLFAVYATRLAIFGNPVGTLTLGTMVTDSVATDAGRALGAEVCFVAGGRCVASTPGVRRGGLQPRMVAVAGAGAPTRVRWNGRRYVLTADRVSTGAGMRDAWRVSAFPLDDVLGPFESIQRVEVLAGVGSLALAVLIGLVLSRGFARPVRALVAATERVAAGDYDVRVEATTRDELGTLAEAFNEMTHGLMLKEQYRGVLDKVVSRDIADELLKGEITLGGETRMVTSLFADVRGFTAMTEGMEPQRVVALLNEIMEVASDAVEAEGGVVDKYVGDEIMAVFGAPVSRGGDADRAVRAALAILAAVDAINRSRVARGEPAVEVGVGINAGPAVAGNMGSTGRLNYTVLGESVNVASRLCDAARGGEILVAASFLRELTIPVDAVPLGPRAFKGLTVQLDVYAIRGIGEAPVPAGGAAAAKAAGVATAVAFALLAATSALQAQRLPTLQDLGVGWTSADGTWQVTPSGRLDVEGFVPGDAPAWLMPSTHPFVAPRASLLVDVFAGARVNALVELRADRGEAPADRPLQARVEQAWLRVAPVAGADLSLQAGKFVSPFGGWTQRHASLAADPFIRPPLPYDYRTMICANFLPGSAAGFVSWKDDPAFFRPMGAPPVWNAPYQVGVMAAGGWKGVGVRAAVMNSAPSSEPSEWNTLGAGKHGPSYVAHVGVQVMPELSVGASYDRGGYLIDAPGGAPLPAGEVIDHFFQELWGFEAAFARGPVEVRGELVLDTWDVPNVPEYPRDVSWYGEAKVKLSPGLFAAARYSGIRFNRIGDGAGSKVLWDYPVDRVQLAAGYRLTRTTELRAEYMLNATNAPPDAGDDLLAVRWSWSF